jgi:TfoX/Sxy family transcriptional regulator of competence genes
MNYHEAPEAVLENPSLMAVWARKGLDAAKEAASKKKTRRKPK